MLGYIRRFATSFPALNNPNFSIRPISERFGSVVETNRPHCSIGYIALVSSDQWTIVPSHLVSLLIVKVQPSKRTPASAPATVSMQSVRSFNHYGDVYCPYCGYVVQDAVTRQFSMHVKCTYCKSTFIGHP